MIIPRIYISAAHKSSGKTTLSLGLCAALTRLGHRIQPFKKGPDYIDPLWLGAASQNTCYNLDFNTMSRDEILHKLASKSCHQEGHKDMVLIEGNMGLYDDIYLEGTTSNASMAKLTQTPIILVIDTQGITRGVAPLLLGYKAFDPDITIAGVIFNKVAGARHQKKLVDVTEHYTDIPVLGCIARSKDMILVERHLGLMPYNENNKASAKISLIADRVQEQVDLEKVLALSKQVSKIPDYHFSNSKANAPAPNSNPNPERTPARLKIGLCKDASFGFYYADDIEALEQAGAEIVIINTLHDQALPEIDGLFIGGGFPETHMQALSDNKSMRHSIYNAIESGMPVYAECGGLMYLTESLSWDAKFPGKTFPMVGTIPAKTVMQQKPQGRGYVKLKTTNNLSWPEESGITQGNTQGNTQSNTQSNTISAHEFHYSRLEDAQGKLTQKGSFAYAVERGFGIDGQHDGWLYKNLLASYSHMRDTSKYHWARRFVAFIHQVKQGNEYL